MTRRLAIDDLYAIVQPDQPAVSPDGTRIVYTRTVADRESDTNQTTLWSIPAAGGEPRQLTFGTADSGPVWSPDGTQIAFLRAAEGSPAQIHLLSAQFGEPRALTKLPTGAGQPVWSPDGTRLAFSAPVLPPAPEPAAKSREGAPVMTDRLDYKSDGSGVVGDVRMHIHVVDVAGGDVRRVTYGDWHAHLPSWSPDGTTLAFSASMDRDSDLTFSGGAYTVDIEVPNADPVRVGDIDIIGSTMHWVQDGQALVLIGRQDASAGHLRLLLLRLDSGEITDLAAALDRNVMPGGSAYPGSRLQLTADGNSVLFCIRDRGDTHAYRVPISGNAAPAKLAGVPGEIITNLSLNGGVLAAVRATPTSFGEVVTIDQADGQVTTLTDHGSSISDIDLYVREEREFTLTDGTVIHGWLLRDETRTEPAPLLLDIHGGPHNVWNGSADLVHIYHQVLVERGWTILTLNPRASDGYGEAFYTAALGAWGELDRRDLLEPVDTLVAERVADPDRLAVSGYSYGGFMTCYLTSRDNRFAAAVTGGVVSDLVSMAGTSDAGHYLSALEIESTPWQNPERYAELSPLRLVTDVRTPTLIVQGDADVRCPVGQAEQWFTALREQGVPTRLVLYPGCSHLFIVDGRPSHRADWNQRIVDWLRQHTVGTGRARLVALDQEHWQRRLTELATRYKVPGAALGILRLDPDAADSTSAYDDQILASHGLLSMTTGVPVDNDTLFQIGSITKPWTATMALQLVDEGKLDLDAPVISVLPELKLADPDATARVTVRHLLTHTSGIDGDVFTDTGRGDDTLARYVEELATAIQIHPLGATFSYCNSGFSLLGRIIEKITGQVWDAALRDRLTTPLGLTHTTTLPEEALLYRTAVGHLADADGTVGPAKTWVLPRSAGPAGIVCATPCDLLAFARMHLTGGLAGDGERLLSEDAAADMAAQHTTVPNPHVLGDSWGLGWIRFDWDGHRLIGHDGNTIGQSAYLRMLPEQGLAVTLLTNGPSRDLYQDLFREIFAEIAGVAMPKPLSPPKTAPDLDLSGYVGTYEDAGARLEVWEENATLRMRVTDIGALADQFPEEPKEYDLHAVDKDLFVLRDPEDRHWTSLMFYRLPDAQQSVHLSLRARPKVS